MTAATALLYECFSGIAGDMHLGALIDLGVPAELFRNQLSKLGLDNQFVLQIERARKQGIEGTLVRVECAQPKLARHRHLPEIHKIIDQAELSPEVNGLAKSIFQGLAEAEARVHGIEIDQVHFHEVGATDAIVDIVGSALGISYLAPDTVFAGPIELGSGMVQCEHGIMPVPAPATAELLKGVPTCRAGVDGEATTPTGAAILMAVVDSWDPPVNFRSEKIGYGIGQNDFCIPNVLRMTRGAVQGDTSLQPTCEIEANIDDMTPESFEPLLEELLQAGAKDVFLTPIMMKKSRPGIRVSALADAENRDSVVRQFFASSSTLGVRVHDVGKVRLPRIERTVDTSLGQVDVKATTLPNGEIRWKTEHDDIRSLASRNNLSYFQAKVLIDKEISEKFK